MVTSFRDFISSRNQKNATYSSPMDARRKQLEGRRQTINEDVYQPNPKLPSFQDSREGEEYREQLKAIDQQSGFISSREQLLQRQAAKAKNKNAYDARIKQGTSFDEAQFIGMSGNTYNPEKDSPAGFIISDKSQYIAEQQAGQVNLSEELKASDAEIESYYYQQLLQKNNVPTMSVTPVKPDGTPDWEEKITRQREQVSKQLMPVSIAGEYTGIVGYQKSALEKETGMSRLGSFAGKVTNPMNEEFIPVAAAQVLGALPGFAAGELGIATPAVSDNMMKAGATAGEWVGFGVGLGSVGRSARWVAEDIALPFLAVRGGKKLIAKAFGQKGIRKTAQLEHLITHADQAAPSVDPTEAELLETGTSPLVFARTSVGGTGSIADNVTMSVNPEGLLNEVTVVKNNATTVYKINTVDDWYNAAGDATGMSKESIEQAKKVSAPVLDALADFYDVPVDDYIRGMSPQVRSVAGDGTFAGRTTPGGLGGLMTEQLDAGYTVMQSQFRKIASLVEFVKKSPGLETNQADSLITLQHELAHVILEDIFEYSRVLGRTNDTRLADLTKTLKEQVIVKAQAGGTLNGQQTSVLNSLSVEEVGFLLNGRTPGRFMQIVAGGGREGELLIGDLRSLLHEAGADLFANYTMNMATGGFGFVSKQATKHSGKSKDIWDSAARALTESWKILKGSSSVNPSGIAVPSPTSFPEHQVVNNFVRILEDIVKSKATGTYTGEGKRIRDAREAQRMEQLPAGQALVLQRAHLTQTIDPADPLLMSMAEVTFGGKNPLKRQYGEQVRFDLQAAQSLITGTTARYTSFAKDIIFHRHYEKVLKRIADGQIHEDEFAVISDTDRLRDTLTFTATRPETKLSVLHDVSVQVRNRLELVDANIPNVEKKLANSAFVNDSGQPVVFYHGATVDFDKNFQHTKTNAFGNQVGPGLYATDSDQHAFSYSINAFGHLAPANPDPRIQAFHILVPKDKVASLEMVGLSDPIGAGFIDGVYGKAEHDFARMSVVINRAELAEAAITKRLSDSSLTPFADQKLSDEAIDILESSKALAKEAKGIIPTAPNIEKLFGKSTLTYLYREFVDTVENLVIADTLVEGDDFQYYEGLFEESIQEISGPLEDDTFKRIFAEAAATSTRNIVEEELNDLVARGVTPTNEQLGALRYLEAQEELIQRSSYISDQVGHFKGDDRYGKIEGELGSAFGEMGALTEVIQDKIGNPHLWQVFKSASLNQFDAPSGRLENAYDLVALQLHSRRNREFIHDIQHTYAYQVKKLIVDGKIVDEPKTRDAALSKINAHYAEYNVEALTEVGGASIGGTPHRVTVLVGSDEVVESNRVFVKPKTKSYARSVQPTGNKVMDGAPYEVIGAGRTGGVAHRAVYDIDAYKGTRLRPVKPVGGNFKGGEQKTYEFSRAGSADEGKSVPLALVSIHRKHKVGIKQSRQTDKPVEDGTGWVMHTKPLGGGADLTLAERQEIADQLLQAPFGWINIGRKKQNIRRVSAIDINTTFTGVTDRQRQIMSDIAAREPSSAGARSFYRKNNPNGNDIDDTVIQGELESSPTSFGRKLEEGTAGINDLNDKAVQEAMDKKLVASPRAVEGPARAGAEILDLQRKAEQGLIISSYHGIPRKVASNLTPPQLEYSKYFGKNVNAPVNKEVLDFVLTDTTGNFRKIDGTITPEGESLIADRLIPEIQRRLDSEEYKTFRKQRDADIEAARTKGTKIILDAEEAHKLPKSDPAYISAVEKEKRINVGKKLTKSEPGGFKPLQIHPVEVQALLNTGFERLKDVPASKGQSKLIRAFDRDGYASALKKLIGVETPHVGSAAELEIAMAAPRLKGMAGTKPLKTAEVLAPHEVQFIWEALGLKTKDRSITPLTKLQMLRDIFTQIFNLPRTLLLSVDLGAIWNQGGMLIGGAVKPITTRRSLQHLAKGDFNGWYKSPDTLFYRNLGNALTGMYSSGNYRAQMNMMTQSPEYTYLTTKTNIHISDIDGPLSHREEAFLGNIFNSVGNVLPATVRNNPFMQKVTNVAGKARFIGYPFKAGERFHTLYLNKMRYEMLNDFNKNLINSGVPEGKKVEALNAYANFLNKATGRGSLGKLDEIAPELSTVLLAPRWMASRFQVPFTVAKNFGKEALDAAPKRFAKGADAAGALRDAKAHAKKLGINPESIIESSDNFTVGGYKGAHVSKQMSQDLVRTFGVIGGITGLLAMNGFEVETDWRKSSFLKVSKDRMNIDLTMGLGSVWRFIARAGYGVTGDRKEVSGSGTEFDADVMRQIGNFTRAKLSPLGASATGVITGTDYFGEEVTGPSTFIPGQSTNYEDFLPLMVQQIKDSTEQIDGGFTQVLLGAGAASGLNVGIYPDKDDIAMELQGIAYKDLYGYEQKYVNRMYYEGTEFVPSEYTQQVAKFEEDQYEFIETIMSGNLPNGAKASRIYRYMDRVDAELHGLRLAYFGEDRNSEEETETNPLKRAQNQYYEMLAEVNSPEMLALLTDEQIEEAKDKFLSSLTPTQRDYIIANKSNFMVPNSVYRLVKPNHQAAINLESKKARARMAAKAKGLTIGNALKESPIDELSSKYYAITRSFIESNQARERLTNGRVPVPSAEEQIELTRSIAAR